MTTLSWLSRSSTPFFVQFFYVFLLHLLLPLLSVSVLYHAHPCVKCSFDISSFLEEISSLSHSIVVLSFFALFMEEGLLISPSFSPDLCIHWVYLSLCPLLFTSLLFSAVCKASSDNDSASLHFFFFGMVCSLTLVQCYLCP